MRRYLRGNTNPVAITRTAFERIASEITKINAMAFERPLPQAVVECLKIIWAESQLGIVQNCFLLNRAGFHNGRKRRRKAAKQPGLKPPEISQPSRKVAWAELIRRKEKDQGGGSGALHAQAEANGGRSYDLGESERVQAKTQEGET